MVMGWEVLVRGVMVGGNAWGGDGWESDGRGDDECWSDGVMGWG